MSGGRPNDGWHRPGIGRGDESQCSASFPAILSAQFVQIAAPRPAAPGRHIRVPSAGSWCAPPGLDRPGLDPGPEPGHGPTHLTSPPRRSIPQATRTSPAIIPWYDGGWSNSRMAAPHVLPWPTRTELSRCPRGTYWA